MASPEIPVEAGAGTPTDPGPAPRRRTRRTSKEVIDRILGAASEAFERKGYAGATTAAIARKAGVAEALIFSNFGSKAQLFQESIFRPLNAHLLEFFARHVGQDVDNPQSKEQARRAYIGELQDFIQSHSGKLVSLFFSQMYKDGAPGLKTMAGLSEYLDSASALHVQESDTSSGIDAPVMARISFALLLSTVIFKDWIFSDDVASDAYVMASVREFILSGLNASDPGRDRDGGGRP